jgi:hypothetical protein
MVAKAMCPGNCNAMGEVLQRAEPEGLSTIVGETSDGDFENETDILRTW